MRTQLLCCVWFFVTSWTIAHRLLCPWNSPGKNTGVGCPFILQGIFLTQESNPCLLPSPPLAGGFFTTEPPGKPLKENKQKNNLLNGRKYFPIIWQIKVNAQNIKKKKTYIKLYQANKQGEEENDGRVRGGNHQPSHKYIKTHQDMEQLLQSKL